MLRYLSILALPLYILDQVTKAWVVRRFAPPTDYGFEEIEVIPGFFWVHRLHNTGVAFGRFNGGEHSNLIFGTISVLALTAIVIMWLKDAFPTKTSRTAATLLISGIFGNLSDRIAHGYVVDFLKFDLQFMVWPSFNVADSCICVAAALLVITAWQKPEKVPERTAAAE